MDNIVNESYDLMVSSNECHDYLSYLMGKLQLALHDQNFLEAVNELEKFKDHDYEDELPSVAPYLNPDEYNAANPDVDKVLPMDYIFTSDRKGYVELVKQLQANTDKDKEQWVKESLLRLGWNPYIPCNLDTLKEARHRQAQWMNEHYKVRIIDVHNMDTNLIYNENSEVEMKHNRLLEPIYIVLSFTGTAFGKMIAWYKNCKYTHSALSLDPKLHHLWSFNMIVQDKQSGLSKEDISSYKNPADHDDADINILCIFVPKKVKKKILEVLDYYNKNIEKTSYSIKNIFRIVLNQAKDTAYSLDMVCSQFVDSVLKISGVDITGNSSNLVAPQDFTTPRAGVTVFNVYEGKKSKYRWQKVQQKVDALKANLTYNQLTTWKKKEIDEKLTPAAQEKKDVAKIEKFFKSKEAKVEANKLPAIKMEDFNIICSDDETVNSVLREIREALTPTPAILEVSMPVGFDKKGGLYIKKPIDLEAEYQEAHRLLSMYDATNMNGIKEELARLFYINSILESKLKKMKKDTKEYKEAMDLRARVLNDFNTYFKIVKNVEKNFNFTDYMKHSDYYNKTIQVDNHTLKYTGSYIKKAVEALTL